MAKQNINVGTAANDKKGDSLRAAFQKVNANFTELYTVLGINADVNLNLGAFEFAGSVMSTTDSTAIVIDQATTISSNLTVGGDVLPSVANGGDLGSSARPWKSLYVSNNTIFLGGTALSIDGSGNLTVGGSRVGATSYTDLTGRPALSTVATTGSYTDLTNRPALFSGSYADLTNKPNLAGTYQFSVAADDSTQRLISTNEVVKFTGAGGITTASDAEGNITITGSSGSSLVNGAKTVSLDSTGSLTLPGDIKSNGNINIDINLSDSTLRRWSFGEDGILTLPSVGKISNGAYDWTFGSTGITTFPGVINAGNINNLVVNDLGGGTSLTAGSQVQIGNSAGIAGAGVIIKNAVTNTLGGESSLESGSKIQMDNGNVSLFSYTYTGSGGGEGLEGRLGVEVDNSNGNNVVRIGLRVTTILEEGNTTSFSGWTFHAQSTSLTLPMGAVINETTSSPGLYRTKYSGNFVLDPTWFAANAGNIVNGDSFPEGVLQNYDEVSGAFSFQYFGYFVPPTTANYTFRAHADETFVFWIGAKALSGYTYANKDMYGNYNGTFPEQQTQSFTIALTAGEFYPIRIQWANGGGFGELDVFTWANNVGQADTANFTGRVFMENTGTAKIAVNNNKSIILSTDNATDNNWTFAPNGSLTFPDATVQTTAYNPSNIRSEGNINIEINLSDSTLRRWQFGEDGNLAVPGDINLSGGTISQYSQNGLTGLKLVANADQGQNVTIMGTGNNTFPILNYVGTTLSGITIGTPEGDWNFMNGNLTIPGDIKSNGNINIDINLSDSTLRRWSFGEDGLLTFPDGTSQSTAGGTWPVTNTAGASGPTKVAIGRYAGEVTQGANAVAIGNVAGYTGQVAGAVAIGWQAGETTQGNSAVAIGNSAGNSSQGASAVAVGLNAGLINQGNAAVAVGPAAGNTSQGLYAVAIGEQSGLNLQGESAVAVGSQAGYTGQGTYSVAVGYAAGQTSQAANTIILNASGVAVNGVAAQTNSFYVAPIRNASATSGVLQYNASTKEVSYSLNVTAERFNTDQITVVGNRISTTVTNANLEIECNGTGGVVINTVADATTASTVKSVGYLGLPQSGTATTATLAIGDAGKHIYLTTTGQTITIPAASSVAYPIGTTITFIAGSSATTTTIAINTDTLRLAGGTSTGSRTLAANGMATAVKVSGTSSAGVWYINGTGLT